MTEQVFFRDFLWWVIALAMLGGLIIAVPLLGTLAAFGCAGVYWKGGKS